MPLIKTHTTPRMLALAAFLILPVSAQTPAQRAELLYRQGQTAEQAGAKARHDEHAIVITPN
jgi:hypothetical protein